MLHMYLLGSLSQQCRAAGQTRPRCSGAQCGTQLSGTVKQIHLQPGETFITGKGRDLHHWGEEGKVSKKIQRELRLSLVLVHNVHFNISLCDTALCYLENRGYDSNLKFIIQRLHV